jgi:hypothetical protein
MLTIYLCTGYRVIQGQILPNTRVHQYHSAYDLSYWSQGYEKQWYQVEGDGTTYSWNGGSVRTSGVPRLVLTPGTDYIMQVTMSSGTDTGYGEVPIRLRGYEGSTNQPYLPSSETGDGCTYSGYWSQGVF